MNKGKALNGYMVEDEMIEILRGFALRGERAPSEKDLRDLVRTMGYKGISNRARTTALAHAGRIKIEVYQQNWRVIQIGSLRTKECPHRIKPIKIIFNTPPETMRVLDDFEGRQKALELPPLASRAR